jgi:hypothetical protein
MPRTRGRPAREKRLSFRLAPEEYDALKAKAEKAKMDVSTFIRAAFPALLSEAGRMQKGRTRHAEDDALLSCLLMLTRIHRNVEVLQQWTKTYRQGADAVSIMAHLVALEREIDRLRAALDRSAPPGPWVTASPHDYGAAGRSTPPGFDPAGGR